MPDYETDDDRLALLEELGDEVIYTPSGGAASTIDAYFDADADVHEIVNGVEVVGTMPMAAARTSDLTGTVLAGTIEVGGITYNIKEVLPDGTGMTDLTLEEA